MKKTSKRKFGDKGENLVTEYLRKEGFVISARNYSCRYGEIDIVAENNELILFVEVKTRSEKSAEYIKPYESVNGAKQQRIIATAEYYIVSNRVLLQPRFDVAEVVVLGDDFKTATLNYIENAFGGF